MSGRKTAETDNFPKHKILFNISEGKCNYIYSITNLVYFKYFSLMIVGRTGCKESQFKACHSGKL